MGFPKYIKNKAKIFGWILIWIFSSYTATNASEAICKYQKLDQFDIFCAQTARQKYLEKTWNILNMAPEKKESKSQIKPIRDIITKELDENKNTEILDNNLAVKWPRPKIITRYFESAVASLDIDGQKDLQSCTTHGLINSNHILNIPEHQLQAIIYFSNTNFKEIFVSKESIVKDEKFYIYRFDG